MDSPQGFYPVSDNLGHVAAVNLTAMETSALSQIMAEIAQIIAKGDPRRDAAVRRLYPDGYRDDPKAATELRQLTEKSLRTAKSETMEKLLATVPAGEGVVALTAEEAEAWLRALTDARLIFADRLSITEETDVLVEIGKAIENDPAGAHAQALALYQYLSFLQDTLVIVMMDPKGDPMDNALDEPMDNHMDD